MTGAQKRMLAVAVGVVLLVAAHAWWLLPVWCAGVVAVWVWRLKKQPMGPCRALSCRAGRNAGSDETQWGACPRCERTPGGRGEEPRRGARLVHPEFRRN